MSKLSEEVNFNQEIGFNEFLDKTKRLPAGGVSCARMAWYSGIAWYKAKVAAHAKINATFPVKMIRKDGEV